MRVTDRLIFDGAIRDTAASRERAEAAMRAASTGTRVEQPGDDPAAAGLMQAFSISSARLEAISRSAGLAASELQAADSALEGIGNALTRARELAVSLSNGTWSAAERTGGAVEVAHLGAEVVARANTRFGNRWILGGDRDGAPPFDAAGSYAGDAAVRQVEIAPGVLQDASIRADVALAGAGGGVDVFQVLARLGAALSANDADGVRASLDGLDRALSQVATARSQAGVNLDAFDSAASAARAAAGDEKTRGDQLGEVDLVQSSIELSLAQRALEASLSASAQGFKLTLLDYLR